MKIRIIKELFGGPAHSIKAGTELYGRIVEMDPLCKMFQCTDGEYIGREIPYKFYVEIPEDKTFAELRVIELEQENLQRLEEVKGLQRQVESMTEFSNKKVEQNRTLRKEWQLTYDELQTVLVDKGLLLAQLERAMFDHQPVVLPKEVAEAIQLLDDREFSEYGIIIDSYDPSKCRIKSPCIMESLEIIRNFTFTNSHTDSEKCSGADLLLKALVNGYTVEKTPKETAIKEVAVMLEKWTNEPTFENEEVEYTIFGTNIVERLEEIYSKN